MFMLLVVFGAFLLSQVRADTFRLPLLVRKHDDVSLVGRGDQALLPGSSSEKQLGTLHGMPMWYSGFFYTVISEIAIGSPQQPFIVIISLRRSDMYVLSSTCEDPNLSRRRHYESADSATYVENGTALNVSFWRSRGRGFISQDALHVGPVSVSDQNFVEAEIIDETGANLLGVYFEGQLGLGPKYGNSSAGAGNLATSMYTQGLISKNLFSMTFAHAADESSAIVFGGTHSDVDLDDVPMIPVTNVTTSDYWDVTNTWQVSAAYVRLGSGIVVNRTLDGYTAWIETEFPFLGLPDDLVDQLNTFIGAYPIGWSPFYGVSCEGRENLPDLVFNLGGRDFAMSPFDYIQKFDDDGREDCISMFMKTGVSDDDKVPVIMLGLGFLKAFETVFDLEKNMVGFIELMHES